MEIRRSTMEDLDTLCKMYESARQFMAFHGNPQQWGQTYPKRTLTESDIASGCSYVCEDQGRIIATFYYREGPDDTYLQDIRRRMAQRRALRRCPPDHLGRGAKGPPLSASAGRLNSAAT